MASRQTAKKSNQKKKKPAAQTNAVDRGVVSVVLFALAVLLIAMLFVKGEAAWATLRGLLFGVFGLATYFMGALLFVVACYVALDKPWKGLAAKAGLLLLLGCTAATVFSDIVVQGQTVAQLFPVFLRNGSGSLLGGGLLGALLGGPLLALCGRPAANVVVLLLLLCAAMLLLHLTPADLVTPLEQPLENAVGGAKELYREKSEAVKEAYRQRAEERQARAFDYDKEEERALQAENVAPEIEPSGGPRSPFDVDLGPDAPVDLQEYHTDEVVEIGPGGTFGMNPLQERAVPTDYVEDFGIPLVPEVEDAALQAEYAPQGGQPSAEPAAAEPLASDTPQAPAAAPQGGESPAPSAQPEPQPPQYRYPPLSLFEKGQGTFPGSAEAELKANAKKLVEVLESFGVKTRVLDISRGPSVTRYELQPQVGVKVSRITSLADDIALNMAVAGVRIEAPIPGKPAVGIEVPNRKANPVQIRDLFESSAFTRSSSPLTFALGKDIAGNPQVADLCKMPHLLIAGTTGSGKSVCVNSVIISLLYRSSPEEVKLILIDPKVVELAEYNGIPHLLMPVVTEPKKAAGALGSAVAEMERRYRLFAQNNVRDIKTYNKLAQGQEDLKKLPYIAIIIDELADLMMVAGKEVEESICRIAQKARAAGMHLIVATQRPSVDVITGLIKANIPSRIAFAVSNQVDSRTILDMGGAEKLLGMGDMLFMPVGASKPVRIQGTYVKDEEIDRVLEFIKQGGEAQYDEDMMAETEKLASAEKSAEKESGGHAAGGSDPVLAQCVETVLEAGQASTSLLQRRCKLGYARAARMMDEMEQMKIIGPYEGAKPRQVLITRQQWLEMSMNQDAPQQEIMEGF